MSALNVGACHLLLALSAVPLVAGGVRLAHTHMAMGAIDASTNRFYQAPWPITLHIVAAALFSVLGAYQLDPHRRAQSPVFHRWAGAVSLVAGLVVAASGAYMAVTYAIPKPLQGSLLLMARLVVSCGMLVSLLLALSAIFDRRYAAHGAWMLRAYALGLGAGTQVLIFVPVQLIQSGPVQGLPRDILMVAAWGINLAVAERRISNRSQADRGLRS